MFINLQV